MSDIGLFLAFCLAAAAFALALEIWRWWSRK